MTTNAVAPLQGILYRDGIWTGLAKKKQGIKVTRASPEQRYTVRACFKIAWGPAARDFGCGQGGEDRASPQRAVRAEPTQAADKRPAARRVFAEKAAWLRCSSVEDPPGILASQALPIRFHKLSCALSRKAVSFVAPRHSAFSAKTGPHGILKQALRWKMWIACNDGQLLHPRLGNHETIKRVTVVPG